MKNPFTGLVEEMEKTQRQRMSMGNSFPRDDIFLAVIGQLKSLEVTLESMMTYDMRTYMRLASSEVRRESYLKSHKAFLDYFQFVGLLNQLGRILEKHGSIKDYNRIRFYRNKVWEHWDDYTNGIGASITQTLGSPAVPLSCGVISPAERREIKKEIDSILNEFNLKLDIKDVEPFNIVNWNVEKIYSVLEQIDPTLAVKKDGKFLIPDRLIKLLFEFGFPAPVQEVVQYSESLVDSLSGRFLLKG